MGSDWRMLDALVSVALPHRQPGVFWEARIGEATLALPEDGTAV